MSIIDTLVIELDLDPAKMSKGARESIRTLRQMETASDKTSKTTSEGWDKAGDAFAKVRREALGAFAVFTAGRSIKALASDVMKLNSELGYTAKQIDMSAQTLAKLEARSQAAGGTRGEVAASFANMQAKLTDPQAASSQARAFQALGVTDYKDANGNIAANIIDRLHDAQQRQHLDAASLKRWLSIAGVTGEGQLREIQMDNRAFAENKRFGDTFPVPSDKDIAQYQALQAHLVELQLHAEALAQKGLAKITPELDHIVTTIDKWIQEGSPLAASIAGVTTAVIALTASMGPLGTALAGVFAANLARGIVSRILGLIPAFARFGPLLEGYVAYKLAGEAFKPLPTANANEGTLIQRLIQSGRIGHSGATHSHYDDTERTAREGRGLAILTGMGYSRDAAMAILGNVARESGFDEQAVGDNGNAVGLAQWHAPRVAAIKKKYGIDVMRANYDEQIRAIGLEAADMGLKAQLNTLSRDAGTALVRSQYERPANRDGSEDLKRIDFARRAANDLGGNQTTFNVGDINITANTNDPKQLAHGLKQALTQMQAQHESRSVVQ